MEWGGELYTFVVIHNTFPTTNCMLIDRKKGPYIQVLRNAVEGVRFPRKKRYKGVRFNVISVTRGWVEVKFPGKSVT